MSGNIFVPSLPPPPRPSSLPPAADNDSFRIIKETFGIRYLRLLSSQLLYQQGVRTAGPPSPLLSRPRPLRKLGSLSFTALIKSNDVPPQDLGVHVALLPSPPLPRSMKHRK